MSLFGTSWDDPKTAAIMGLAGGLLQGNAGAGLQQGLLGYQRQAQINREVGREDRELARQTKLDSRSDEKHLLEMAALKRAALSDAALGRLVFGEKYEQMMGGGATPSASSVALAQGAQAGSVGPTPANAARMEQRHAAANPLSGLDQSAVQMDYLINKGKNLPEWLFKRNTPDMQVTNGYAFDKNRVQPGFLPGVSTSASGQTTVTMPDGQGGVRVQAPAGALDTYASYRRADEDAKARADLVPVPTSNGQVRYMPRSDALAATAGGPAPQAFPTMGNANITAEVRGLIEADAAKNGITNPTIRMNTTVPGQTLGLASGPQIGVQPSAAEASADKRRADASVDVDVARQANIKKAKDFLRIADQAESLLKKGPTQSGIGSLVDYGASLVGVTTPGSEAAQSLKAVGGWLVANVPRMEGPQSNFDVANYQVMAADVANDQLPVQRRLSALREIKRMMNGVIEGPSDMPANDTPSTGAVPLPSNPTASNLKRGTVYDTPRGRAVWDGMQFKKVD